MLPEMFIHRAEKPIRIAPVLSQYYSAFDFGITRTPIEAGISALAELGITIHPDTFGRYREGSVRSAAIQIPEMGELLLLNALLRDEKFTTPSVADVMGRIVDEGKSLTGFQDSVSRRRSSSHRVSSYARHMRSSVGLTDAIAEKLQTKPENITRLIRGIRIDGAYIAAQIPSAWDKFKEIVELYCENYESLDLSLQRNLDMVDQMRNAKSSAEVYSALYKTGEHISSARRVGAFVPYELDYWSWLIDQGIIASYSHLPFTRIVAKAKAHNLFTPNKDIARIVEADTNIPVDTNIIQSRGQLIRHDLPDGFT